MGTQSVSDLSKMPGDDGEEVTIKDLRSPPRNARFPQYNQMRYCFDEYWQFQSCMAKASKAGEDGESKCLPMYKNLMALCPNEWLSRGTRLSKMAGGRGS